MSRGSLRAEPARCRLDTVRRVLGCLLLSGGASVVVVSGAGAQDAGQLQVTVTVPAVVLGYDVTADVTALLRERQAGRAPLPDRTRASVHAGKPANPVPHVVVDTLRASGSPPRVRVTTFFE